MTTEKPARPKSLAVASWRLPLGRPIFSFVGELKDVERFANAGFVARSRVALFAFMDACSWIDGPMLARPFHRRDEAPRLYRRCWGGVNELCSWVVHQFDLKIF